MKLEEEDITPKPMSIKQSMKSGFMTAEVVIDEMKAET